MAQMPRDGLLLLRLVLVLLLPHLLPQTKSAMRGEWRTFTGIPFGLINTSAHRHTASCAGPDINWCHIHHACYITPLLLMWAILPASLGYQQQGCECTISSISHSAAARLADDGAGRVDGYAVTPPASDYVAMHLFQVCVVCVMQSEVM